MLFSLFSSILVVVICLHINTRVLAGTHDKDSRGRTYMKESVNGFVWCIHNQIILECLC